MTAAVVGPLRPEQAGEAVTVQYAAYLAEARRYGTTEIPPLRETSAELADDLRRPGVLGFGAWLGARLVGSVRLRPGADGAVELARFAVAPDVQGCGVGTLLMTTAHDALRPGARTCLITGASSEENLRLYRRAGYVEVGHEVDAVGVP